MNAAGSAQTRLVIIRGNSGSGKSALAVAVRDSLPRGVAIIGQDLLRRNILHVLDKKGSPAVDFIDLSARFALDRGFNVIVEGILHEEIYGDILRALVSDHRGMTRCYRFNIPFSETLKRHANKADADEFGETEMRQWWRDENPLTGVDEALIGPEQSLRDSVSQVLADCDLRPLDPS
jgi:ABC-type dipeptide/oligopeptide/nickel transport system ATPase component